MSSVELKSSSDDKLSMYEGMVENLVKDESSRYMLDGMLKCILTIQLLKVKCSDLCQNNRVIFISMWEVVVHECII